ncbi:unannotated protein [freshwater metagenome]|uniref:Unannotated protein n=1 Tax=freshwater metagenome TaxID=449393 RepID=A0A6J6A023_9ZZZZ
MRRFLLVMALACWGQFASAQEPKATVFVGPQIRDGFADIDSGIRDSIRDIQQEIRIRSELELSADRDTAMLTLTVLARGIVTNGSVGVASAALGGGFVVPNTTPTLTTLLGTARYERRMQSESGTWRGAAKVVVDDILAWWEVNRRLVLRR